MITGKNILDYLWMVAPRDLKEDWDNVGFLCGHADRQVTKLLVALDPTVEVAGEAAALGCQLVVTHHPVTFGAKAVTDTDMDGRKLLAYLENGIALICMHTNLDFAPGGVNDVLAQRLGLKQAEVLPEGSKMGLIRYGQVPAQDLQEFVKVVKAALGCQGLRYVDAGRRVCRVAVGGGSCSDFMLQVLEAGCDTFVTADVKYHGFCDARSLGLNLIDAGHFQTENPVCAALGAKLSERFPELTVYLSKRHKDVIEFA